MSQLEGRINNQILGVKELTRRTQRHSTLQRLLLPTSETEGSVYRQRKGRRVGGGDGAMDWFSLKSSAQRLEGTLDLVESNTVANLTSD